MIIAQITDTHISADFKQVQRVNVVENFEKTLKSICAYNPNLIVHTGDQCYIDSFSETFRWTKEKLEETGVPYFVIPGNHDNSCEMALAYNMEKYLCERELYYSRDFEEGRIVFMDSSRGYVSQKQLSWFEKQIDVEQNCLIFIHHPMVEAVPYMDMNHSLQNKDELLAIISKSKNVKGVFCGHYHVNKIIYINQIPICITPSTFFQIDDKQDTFKVGSLEIGWRKIKWNNNLSKIKTEVITV